MHPVCGSQAFHIFKVFVANPSKPAAIRDILIKNKTKLVTYLSTFLAEKSSFLVCGLLSVL